MVLDNRGNTVASGDGIDRYNLSGTGELRLRSEWGLIARNASTNVSLGGGKIVLDNTGNGGPEGNTGPDLDVPLNAILNTISGTTTTLDTNDAANEFILLQDVIGTGTLALAGPGIVRLAPAMPQTISAELSGNTSIVKSAASTSIISSTNSAYTGTTTVTAGTLEVNGSLADVTVNGSGILSGMGTVGAVDVQSGGTLSPGTGAATLNVSSVNMAAGSAYAVEMPANGVSDKINAAGTITANGTVFLILSGGYVPDVNDSFDLADAGLITGSPTFDTSMAVLPAGLVWDTSPFTVDGTIRVIATSDPYAAWATSFGVGGKTADDDGDNSSNLLEFATNSTPNSGSSRPKAYVAVPTSGTYSGVLTYTIATRINAIFAANGSPQVATKDNIIYTVEASDNTQNWTTVVVTEITGADATTIRSGLSLPTLDANWEWHTFRTEGAAPADPSEYIRLRVEPTP
jgi:autotransporter-associated beta strand protein